MGAMEIILLRKRTSGRDQINTRKIYVITATIQYKGRKITLLDNTIKNKNTNISPKKRKNI